MEYLIVFGVIFAIVIIGVGIWGYTMRNKSLQANESFVERLQSEGFIIDKRVELDIALLLVDNKHKKWIVCSGGQHSAPYNFTDLNDYEVYEDGDSIVKGRAGSTLVGGALFGGVGAIAGAARSRPVKRICSQMELRLYVNDIQNPVITIPLLFNKVETTSLLYKQAIEKAKLATATLSFIINDTESQEPSPKTAELPSIDSKIRSLKKLKDDGLITDAEYEDKRKALIDAL